MQKTIKYIRKLLNKTICQQRLKQAQLSQGEESEINKITLKYKYFMNMPQCTHTYTLSIYIYTLHWLIQVNLRHFWKAEKCRMQSEGLRMKHIVSYKASVNN